MSGATWVSRVAALSLPFSAMLPALAQVPAVRPAPIEAVEEELAPAVWPTIGDASFKFTSGAEQIVLTPLGIKTEDVTDFFFRRGYNLLQFLDAEHRASANAAMLAEIFSRAGKLHASMIEQGDAELAKAIAEEFNEGKSDALAADMYPENSAYAPPADMPELRREYFAQRKSSLFKARSMKAVIIPVDAHRF